MGRAYYNENDPGAAEWLRELERAGLIAPGVVDERDIRDVTPNDLVGFSQCHFFAGIGVWSYALRLAGWPDDRPVWTGSCPCQPFSAAGRRTGFADERHLWPAWFWLISQSRPDVVFGEQVASSDGDAWLDLVSSDLEGAGYACGPLVLPAAGVGAPHGRHRLFFVADSEGERRHRREDTARSRRRGCAEDVRDPRLMGDPHRQGRQGRQGERGDDGTQLTPAQRAGGEPRGLADAKGFEGPVHEGLRPIRLRAADLGGRVPTRGFWADADWIYCRDGNYRPVEPGTFPLAHGAPARVGYVCAPCLEGSAQGANDEDLSSLRQVPGASDRRLSPEVLLPGLPVEESGQGAGHFGGRPMAGAAYVSESHLRKVRSDRGESSSSHGRQSQKQRAREHRDTLPEVPHSGASGCERCGALRPLYEVKIMGNRIPRLRGYGNAINAEAAAAFIRAYQAMTAPNQHERTE
jgi:DNA (cytosine-5)-methyltransferase 1